MVRHLTVDPESPNSILTCLRLARENARAILREANSRLIAVERTLTSNEGLPNRPWYKHEIYAPGFYTGYGVKTLPGVRESIEQKQWKQADEQIVLVGKVLENAGEAIQGAAAELTKAAHN